MAGTRGGLPFILIEKGMSKLSIGGVESKRPQQIFFAAVVGIFFGATSVLGEARIGRRLNAWDGSISF